MNSAIFEKNLTSIIEKIISERQDRKPPTSVISHIYKTGETLKNITGYTVKGSSDQIGNLIKGIKNNLTTKNKKKKTKITTAFMKSLIDKDKIIIPYIAINSDNNSSVDYVDEMLATLIVGDKIDKKHVYSDKKYVEINQI
jgi:hypothetical protein